MCECVVVSPARFLGLGYLFAKHFLFGVVRAGGWKGGGLQDRFWELARKYSLQRFFDF